MQEDSRGFLYPRISPSLCVECGLCRQVCPSNHLPAKHEPLSADIVSATKVEDRHSSTSGGIAHVIAKHTILQGGVVYGSADMGAAQVEHIRITSLEGLEAIRGSKYVQSTIGPIYRQVKKDLIAGRTVLFIGTPCQNAGLIRYLMKPYENLTTIDFVCHGVPNQKMLSHHIKQATHSAVDPSIKTAFRKKEPNGKSIYGVFVTDKHDKCIYQQKYPKDLYITAFIHGLIYRDNCYQCLYSTHQRVSDITLGDYWDKENKYHRDELSMLITNTSKGESLIRQLQSEIALIDRSTIDYFSARNQQLRSPMPRHPKQQLFWDEYTKNGFHKAARLALKNSYKAIRRQKIKKIILHIPLLSQLLTAILKLKNHDRTCIVS